MSDITPEEPPYTRGRRDPALAERMLGNTDLTQDDDELGADIGSAADIAFVGLMPGDMIVGKAVVGGTTPEGRDCWFTWGVQSRVLEQEHEEQAADRVIAIINQRVLDLADEVLGTLEERKQEAARNRERIPARRE